MSGRRTPTGTSSDMAHSRYAVILAGGSGTRLWPLSTRNDPKQFQQWRGGPSLIQQTYDRLGRTVPAENIYVSTTREYEASVRRALPSLQSNNIIVEPRASGKPAAFVLFCQKIALRDPNAVILSVASDSVVTPEGAFSASCIKAFALVEEDPDWTILLGVRPTRADGTLGYVIAGEPSMDDPEVRVVEHFVEKPEVHVADDLVASGSAYWNTSHYCFSASAFLRTYAEIAPVLTENVLGYLETSDESLYSSSGSPHQELVPLVHKGSPIGVVEGNFRWYDVGTWPSLYRALEAEQETRSVGRHVDAESRRTLVVNEGATTIATAGLEDVAVIVSNSVVLVASLEHLERNPEIVSELREQIEHRGQADWKAENNDS